ENPRPGGQIYRQSPSPLQTKEPPAKSASAARGAALLGQFQRLQESMTLRNGIAVWGVFPPRRLALSGSAGPEFIEAEHLVLAPGAAEYVPPFPGWTLPGVMTPGCAQLLVKTM